MKANVVTISRIILGLIFLVFGSNGLLMVLTGQGFIPMPPPKPEMLQVMSGFFAVKYLMPLVKGLQVISGVFLISNRFVNLALVFLAPIAVNILGVHLFVDPEGLPLALIIALLIIFQIHARWSDFRPLVSIKS